MPMNALALQQRSAASLLAGTAALALLPFLLTAAFPSRLYRVMDAPSYLVFHNFAEFFSVMVSLSIFGIGWFTFGRSRDRRTLFLASAFLAIGLLDFMHMLAYAGMPAFITPNSANKSTQYWIAVRLLTAGAFLAGAFIRPGSDRPWLSRPALLSAAIAVTALVFTGITFFPSRLPATYAEGTGLTDFKKFMEYAIIFVLLLAAGAHGKLLTQSGERTLVLYLAAFILCIFSELVFTVYKSVFDTYNFLGHTYKIIAFALIYRALFTSAVDLPYARLADANDRLHAEMAAHRSAEEKLLDSEKRLSAIANSARDAIIMMDDGGSISFWNPAAEAIFGHRAAEALGRNVHELLAPRHYLQSYRDAFPAWQATGAGNAVGKTLELSAVRKDGREFPIELSLATFKLEGRWVAVGIARDVTERRRAEEAEIARKAAEEANKAKSDFLANMSHELRTPMNSILGFSEVLLDDLVGNLNEKQRTYVNNIYGSGMHLLDLINDILDLSKVESGKMTLDVGRFSLADLMNASAALLKEKAIKRKVRLEVGIAPEARIALEADERKLKQILFNLLSNAVKFTPEGGSVRVSARKVRGSGVRGPGSEKLEQSAGVGGQFPIPDPRDPIPEFIEISVADTGIGIRQEDIPKLFREFTQLESAYTKNYEGTGLGLALTKRLVELHGGRIGVESEFGKGSTFTFVMPVKQPS